MCSIAATILARKARWAPVRCGAGTLADASVRHDVVVALQLLREVLLQDAADPLGRPFDRVAGLLLHGRLPHDHDLAGAEQAGELIADAGQRLFELLVVLDAASEELAERDGRQALALEDFVDLLDSGREPPLAGVRHGSQVRDRLVVPRPVGALAKRPRDLVLLLVVEAFPARGLLQLGDGVGVGRDAGVERQVVAALVFAADGSRRLLDLGDVAEERLLRQAVLEDVDLRLDGRIEVGLLQERRRLLGQRRLGAFEVEREPVSVRAEERSVARLIASRIDRCEALKVVIAFSSEPAPDGLDLVARVLQDLAAREGVARRRPIVFWRSSSCRSTASRMAAAIAPVVSSLTSSPKVSLKLSAASTFTFMSTPFFGRKLVDRNRLLFENASFAWVDVALSIVTPFGDGLDGAGPEQRQGQQADGLEVPAERRLGEFVLKELAGRLLAVVRPFA